MLTKATVVGQVNVKHLMQLLQERDNILNSDNKLYFCWLIIYYCVLRR